MRPEASAESLEVRRRIAGRLLQEGKGIREVARLVGAAPSAVFRWKSGLEEGGIEALRAKPHPGRPSRLSAKQKAMLLEVLRQGPQAAGFVTDLWPLPRVAKVIEDHLGVKYHPGRVWYVLRELGWSPQKPERRARERDEAAIECWREEEWEEVRKRPASKNGASS